MTLPALVKTWLFNNNQTCAGGTVAASNRLIILAIKNSLIGFASTPYTVRYSCNGTTAGTAGDAVDRWTTTADIVFGAPTAAHSWMVLKQTGMGSNYQVLISAGPEGFGAISANTLQISVIVSPSAGFTGGTTTARPTATDEIVVLRSSNGTIGVGGNFTTAATIFRLHVQQSTDGTNTHVFLCSGGVTILTLLLKVPSLRIGSGWSNPATVFAGATLASTTAPLSFGTANQWASSTTTTGKALIGSTAVSLFMTAEASAQGLSCSDTSYGNVANDITGEWHMFPVGLACKDASFRGNSAALVDTWFGSIGIPTGDTYDVSSLSFAQFEQLIVPWDGTTVPAMA